jgi:hypothetical protein
MRLASVTSDGDFAYVQAVAVMLPANARVIASSWSPVPIVSLLLVAASTQLRSR